MKPIGLAIVGLLVLFVLAMLISAIGGAVDAIRGPSAAEIAAEYARAQQIEQHAALEREWAPVRAAAFNLVLILAAVGALAYGAALASLHVRRTQVYAVPDSTGLLPVERADQQTARASLAAFHAARIEEARRPVVPMVPHHYSPRISYEYETTGPALLPGAEAAGPSAPTLPGVIDLADINHTPSLHSILLGLGSGGAPITVPVKSLWHIALAGPTGNGKSNIARLVVAQLQAIGAKVCVGDPKWTEYDAEQDEDWRPIARRLAREPAYDAMSIKALLRWAADPKTGELERRLELRRRGEKAGSPIFIYLDELPWIAKHVPDAAQMIGDLVRVGRGVGLFLLVGAQDMLAKTIDLSAERENFRTGFYLGGDDKTGAVLLGIPQRDVSDPDGLGVAWLRSSATTPPQQVRVPYASNRAVYQLLGDGSTDLADFSPASRRTSPPASGPASNRSVGSEREASLEATHEAGASGVLTRSPRDRQILSLVAQQKGISEIIAEVWGVKGGSKYSEHSAEVMRVIAQNLRGEQ